MMDAHVLQAFKAAMARRGIIPPDQLCADGKLHRCDAEGRNGKGDAAYLLHLDGVPAGGFQNWKDGRDWENWQARDSRSYTPEERAQYNAKLRSISEERRAEELRRHKAAQKRAGGILDAAATVNGSAHPYLARKGIGVPAGVRCGRWPDRGKDDCLLVPLRDANGELWNLQAIFPEKDEALGRDKDFLMGGRKRGCYFAIGKPGDVLCIVEGFATGMSVHEATGYAVAVAFDCGNLGPVAKALREKLGADVRLILCADDDHATAGNPGLTKAREAAQAVGGLVAVPDFGDARSDQDTDFNDLARAQGADAVRRCVEAAERPNETAVASNMAYEAPEGPPLPPLEAYANDRWESREGPAPEDLGPAGMRANSPARSDADRLLKASFWASDAAVNLNLPYVVKGVFTKGQIVVLWGAPGSGKTFAALDLSAYVGASSTWRGRRVRGGNVVYVAAESSRPHVENRLAALKRERPELANTNVLIVPLALDLLHAKNGDVLGLIDLIKRVEEERGEVVLVVVDTLAVTFGGGNENSPEDMGGYVGNIIRIKQETGVAVLVVHHCGKDEARGMRGHTALLGALDAELAVEGVTGDRILRAGKVREGEGFADLFAFRLRAIELGSDQDGDPVRSCVIDGLGEEGAKRARRDKSTPANKGTNQTKVLAVLGSCGGRLPRLQLAQKLREGGMERNRISEAIKALIDNGTIREAADNWIEIP